MEHFFNNIQGWFNFISIYIHIIDIAEDGDHFVEVGAWKGKSAAFMATEIANSGKQIKFDVVDTWEGSEEHKDDDIIKSGGLYELFINNMKPAEGYYNPIRTTSIEASKLYEDNSLDFVLLDAAHDYDSIKADIEAWLPKVKPGGIIAGDDYHHTWPGIIKAVDELLPDRQVVDNVCWAYQKEDQ